MTYHKPFKAIVFSLGALLLTAPLVLAADQKKEGASTTQQGQQQSGTQTGQPAATPIMGSQSTTIIFATVEKVNEQQETVTLRGTEGATMEMEVPEKTLSELQSGDMVEVAINRVSAVSTQKLPQGQQSGQQSMGSSSQQSSQTGASSAQGGEAVSATVKDINQKEGTVTLQTAKGKTVEIQVPENTLSNLQDGDSVQVSIRKSEQGKQSGTSGKQR